MPPDPTHYHHRCTHSAATPVPIQWAQCRTCVSFCAQQRQMAAGESRLPALLSHLGPRINSLRVPIPGANRKSRFWEKFSTRVMKNPVRWLLPAMAVLLLLGSPFLHVQLTAGGIETLPPDLESRQAIEILEDEFPAFTASVRAVFHQTCGLSFIP